MSIESTQIVDYSKLSSSLPASPTAPPSSTTTTHTEPPHTRSSSPSPLAPHNASSDHPVGSFRLHKNKSVRNSFRAGDKHKKHRSSEDPHSASSSHSSGRSSGRSSSEPVSSSNTHESFLAQREAWKAAQGNHRKTRTVSVDLGLMSMSELQGESRKNLSMQQILQQHTAKRGFFPTQDEAKETTRWFLDQFFIKVTYDDVMMFVTLFALFGSDIKLVAFDSGADATFDSLNLICFWLFFIELALNAWAKSEFGKDGRLVQGYFGSFFFWLDLLALWSITLEVPSLAESTGQGQLVSADSSDHAEGFKAGRVVRMIRLVRLVKLYKITSQRRQEKKMLEDLEVLIEQGRMEEEEIEKFKMNMNHQKQSKVGTDLVDTITRKVIMMILSMLLMVPYLTFEETPRHFEVSTSLLNNVIKNDPADCLTINPAVQHMIKATNRMGRDVPSEYHEFELLDLVVDPDQCNITDTVFDALRAAQGTDGASYTGFVDGSVRKDFVYPFCAEEKCPVEGDEDRICTTCTKFDVSKDAMEGAKQSIFLTLFVIVILISMSIAFENDAQTLILTPIEQMMSMINMVADDPLEEFDFADMVGSSTQYELKVVVLAIQKITTLLRIGFGEAGAEIISKNMSVEGGSSQGLDPMIPGKRMYAIFGFCDIHEFDMCTEVLEDEIMTFVNSVARIVHDQVTRWGGTCNKNLGNAFLMIWRIGDEEDLIDNNARKRILSQQSDGETVHHASVNLKRIPGLDDLSDKALLGFLKVVVEINRDKQVLAYRNDKRLQHEGHDFKLRMGFGLHAGWGIEGAVGSLQKVDATYLSPHVNMSARMEAASRQFGVAVLMTESFFELMSNEAQSVCRRLDIVTVKGSAQPMPIYTYDTFQNQEFPELLAPKNTDLSLASLLKKQADNYTTREWTTDRDLLQLRGLATPAFNEKFKEGINAYLAANWAKARQLLEECDKMMEKSDRGGDGPSQTILGYMRNRAWQCPPEWQGYRPLTSK